MVKSSRAEMTALREACFARDGYRCVWPGCGVRPCWDAPSATLQMAHLNHRGMGGSREANRLDNVVALCELHHSVFDGRDGSANTKRELAVMLRAVAGI